MKKIITFLLINILSIILFTSCNKTSIRNLFPSEFDFPINYLYDECERYSVGLVSAYEKYSYSDRQINKYKDNSKYMTIDENNIQYVKTLLYSYEAYIKRYPEVALGVFATMSPEDYYQEKYKEEISFEKNYDFDIENQIKIGNSVYFYLQWAYQPFVNTTNPLCSNYDDFMMVYVDYDTKMAYCFFSLGLSPYTEYTKVENSYRLTEPAYSLFDNEKDFRNEIEKLNNGTSNDKYLSKYNEKLCGYYKLEDESGLYFRNITVNEESIDYCYGIDKYKGENDPIKSYLAIGTIVNYAEGCNFDNFFEYEAMRFCNNISYFTLDEIKYMKIETGLVTLIYWQKNDQSFRIAVSNALFDEISVEQVVNLNFVSVEE